MAQLILCWQQQIQCKVDTFAKKEKKKKKDCSNMVITNTDVSTNELQFWGLQPYCQKVLTFLK